MNKLINFGLMAIVISSIFVGVSSLKQLEHALRAESAQAQSMKGGK